MSLQNLTTSQNVTDEQSENCKELTYEQQRVAEWHAANGMQYWDIVELGVVKRPSAKKLATELGISRQTIYDWPKVIPDFKEHIRKAQFGMIQINITAVWNGIFLKAAEGDVKAAEMYLSYFSDYRPPKSMHEAPLIGLGDAIAETRRKMAKQGYSIT